jgi:hypothetical protein
VSGGWSPERKAKQRMAIYAWRPWEKSTGPKTALGKQAVALNALKHGKRTQAVLAEQRAILELLKELRV